MKEEYATNIKYREAVQFEKKGARNKIYKKNLEAAKNYELAADSFVTDSMHKARSQGDYRGSLNHAIQDYKIAVKFYNNEKDMARVTKKLNSVNTKYEESTKRRTSMKLSHKGIRPKDPRIHSSVDSRNRINPLEQQLAGANLALPIFSIFFFSFALIFSSFSITGFAITEEGVRPVSYIALGCFALGLIFAGLYLLSKKKKSKSSSKKTKKKTTSKKKK